jgi:hypothetical protein
MDDACYCDDGDPPIFYRKSEVLSAREPHTCYECHRAILPGESYEKVHAMWERDRPETIHTCAWCIDLRDWMMAHVPCFCFMHGGLMTLVREELENNWEARDALAPEVEAMLAELHARPPLSEFAQSK